MRLVVDSSILIDSLRGGPIWEEVLQNAKEDLELFLPTIVIFELFSGKSSKDSIAQKQIHQLLKFFRKIELNQKIARHAGELRRDAGKNIDSEDCIIAASAMDIGGTVLTLNKKHFAQIPGLSIYPL